MKQLATSPMGHQQKQDTNPVTKLERKIEELSRKLNNVKLVNHDQPPRQTSGNRVAPQYTQQQHRAYTPRHQWRDSSQRGRRYFNYKNFRNRRDNTLQQDDVTQPMRSMFQRPAGNSGRGNGTPPWHQEESHFQSWRTDAPRPQQAPRTEAASATTLRQLTSNSLN